MKPTEECRRNIGIDMLRICSMLMIVTMHLLKQGGILAAVDGSNRKCYIMWLVEIFCFCAVNCYALISGYVGIKSKFRLSKIVMFWLQIVCYTVVITAIFAIFRPGSVNLRIWWKAVFPVLSGQYWYMSCYLILMLFIPFVNQACAQMPKRQFTVTVGLMVVMLSVIPCVLQGYPFNFSSDMDPLGLKQGYSVLWLLVLYIIGAYIRQQGWAERIKARWAVGMISVSVLSAWGCLFLMPALTMKRFGEVRYAGILLSYTSPAMLMAAVGMLILFAKIRVSTVLVTKSVTLLSSASLGVYLIHVHPLIWDYFVKDCMVWAAEFPTAVLLMILLFTAAGVYLICTGAELLRSKVFQLLRVGHLCSSVLDREQRPYEN